MICDYIECTSGVPGYLACTEGERTVSDGGGWSVVVDAVALVDPLLVVPPSAVVSAALGLDSATEWAGANLSCMGSS